MCRQCLKMAKYLGIFVVILILAAQQTWAVPSFARQTNLACTACHSIFPQLNAFGRQFKINGYTLTGINAIESKAKDNETILKLLSIPPFSAMAQTSFNSLREEEPRTQNDNIEFPQQLSFFLAGEITPHLGAFIQITYDDQGASFGWDNTDIRFANNTSLFDKDLIYGVTLNNNPTVQDLWNNTPAWGFPYASSSSAPSIAAATLVDGGLAQQVAGAGGYLLYDNLIYGEFDVYRSAPQGFTQPLNSSASNVIKGVSPYWRVAVQKQWAKRYLEIGTYGLASRIYGAGISGAINRFTDIAFDLQFEHNLSFGNCTAHATWIHEKQELEPIFSANNSNNLETFRVDGNLYFLERYAFSLGYFTVTGNKDTELYSPSRIDGSRVGKPNSNGLITQIDFLPWLNAKFSLQYVLYNNFNGAKSNYDGYGRDATDNNTIYVLAWLLF